MNIPLRVPRTALQVHGLCLDLWGWEDNIMKQRIQLPPVAAATQFIEL